MYEVLFYENQNGYSELFEQIQELMKKSEKNKDARIQYKQILLCVELLKQNGTKMNNIITKFIRDGIWELRPGNNRILYFYFKNDKYVLLHMFRKKTNKTPEIEIERAIREKNDYILRNGDE